MEELYDIREKSLKDKISALETAELKGIEKGIEKVAVALLDILDDKTIALKTGLKINEIRELRK